MKTLACQILLVCLAAASMLTAAVPRKPTANIGGKPGQTAPNFTLDDLQDHKWTLYDLKGARAVVLFFTGTECPLANRYIGRLNELSNLYFAKGVVVFAVNPNALEPVAAIRKHAKDYQLSVNVLLDRDQKVADGLGVELTPTAIVLDAAWRVRYRGQFDDNPTEAHVKKTYVRDAVRAILGGAELQVKETKPWGCMVQHADEATPSDVTYHGQIAALLSRHCVGCHRPGESGPFSLVGYEAARRWAKTAKVFTQSRRMPPWRAEPHGLFRDEVGLTDAEIAMLARWADAGAPRGDGKPPPEPQPPAPGWTLGEPDLTLDAPAYETSAGGDDEYRCFVLPTGRQEDVWVRAVEVRPGNKQVVRHVVVYAAASGAAEKLGASYRSPGTWPGFEPEARLDGWAPGRAPAALPDGAGWLLRRSARVVLEVHYHPTGRKEADRTRVGLYFAKKPVRQAVRWLSLGDSKFQLAAGRAGQRVTAQLAVPEDLHALSITPHMHYMGRDMKVEAEAPDGKRRTLLHSKDWDFHWQETYHFKTAEPLRKGTTLHLTATFDTSLDNPNTPPDLPKTIPSGQRTTDEMCVAWIAYLRDGEDREQ